MFVYICIFVLAVLWLGLALIIFYLFGKYSDLIKEYQKLEDVYYEIKEIIFQVYQIIEENVILMQNFKNKE